MSRKLHKIKKQINEEIYETLERKIYQMSRTVIQYLPAFFCVVTLYFVKERYQQT